MANRHTDGRSRGRQPVNDCAAEKTTASKDSDAADGHGETSQTLLPLVNSTSASQVII